MKIEKIKPIPKYIIKKIQEADRKSNPYIRGNARFYAYLTKNDGELVKVTVAVKTKYDKLYCKQVAVHGIDSKRCFIKDIVYYYIGGYIVGWNDLGLTKEPKWYEFGQWGEIEDKYFDPSAPVVNPEYALTIPEFKYSAADQYGYCTILKYLRLYRKYPEAEYIVKMGLQEYADSRMILQKAHKDKAFRKWLYRNAHIIRYRGYYVETILTAYKEKQSLDKTQAFLKRKNSFLKETHHKDVMKVFGNDLKAFFAYCDKQNIEYHTYRDYMLACNRLQLDMTDPKNKCPHDFMRWHDIRIDEYRTMLKMEEREQKKQFYDMFENIAKKFLPLQYDNQSAYIVLIAKSPVDLQQEGESLHHCVGKMNYDQKFIREESLIFFVRSKEKPDVPFVTMEYSLDKHKVLQCYADKNAQPEQTVLDFVHKKWLPYAKKQLKKIA